MRAELGNSKQIHLECKAIGMSGRSPQFSLTESRAVILGRGARVIQPQFPPSAGIPLLPSLIKALLAPAHTFLGLPFVRKFFLKSMVMIFPSQQNPRWVLTEESACLLQLTTHCVHAEWTSLTCDLCSSCVPSTVLGAWARWSWPSNRGAGGVRGWLPLGAVRLC